MLRTLVAVSETGSVTAAANRVGRSPGAVSATVQQFEGELGIQVFVRKPAKGMAVTSYGKLLMLEAKGLLAHADEFRSIAGALGSARQGEITVGCFTNLAPMLLAGLIAGFKDQYPGINVHILVGDQETLLQSLHTGVIELAISFDIGLTDTLAASPLAAMPPRAVLSPGHPLAGADDLSLAQLIDEPFILMDLPYTREYFLSIFHALGLKPKITYRSQSFETIRTLVGNNLGYSLLNLQPKTDQTYEGTSVVHIPIRESLQPLQIVLLTLNSLTRRSIVHTFKEYAASYLRMNGPS